MSERTYLAEDIRDAVEAMLPRLLEDTISRVATKKIETLTTEQVRALARSEAEAVGNEAQKECIERGPICGVWKEIERMRTVEATLQTEQTKLLAVLGFWKWAMPIVMTVIGIVVGVLAPRVWPVHAQAQPVQQVQSK